MVNESTSFQSRYENAYSFTRARRIRDAWNRRIWKITMINLTRLSLVAFSWVYSITILVSSRGSSSRGDRTPFGSGSSPDWEWWDAITKKKWLDHTHTNNASHMRFWVDRVRSGRHNHRECFLISIIATLFIINMKYCYCEWNNPLSQI